MSAYKVIEAFVDLQNGGHRYHVGDVFPHDGIAVSEKRINELSSAENRRKMPLIKKVDEVEVEEVLDAIPEEVFVAEPFMNEPEENGLIKNDESEVESDKKEVKSTRGRKTQK